LERGQWASNDSSIMEKMDFQYSWCTKTVHIYKTVEDKVKVTNGLYNAKKEQKIFVTNLITPRALFSPIFLQSCSHDNGSDDTSRDRPIFI